MFDKSYGINWKDVIIKVVLLVLFILLLFWIIPHPNLNAFYDAVFNDNLQTMKNAAKAYYTVDELPENIGESVSMTLAEMENKKMIVPFVDKDGEYCDSGNSYAKVTKTASDKYMLKVLLKCKDQENYIEEVIGCYDVCEGDNCACATEYEYKQTVSENVTTYTCPSGWTKDGKSCYKIVGGSSIDSTKVVINGTTTTVDASKSADGYVYINAERRVEANGGYYECPSGYTLSGSTCYRYINDSDSRAAKWVSGTASYTCPSGYVAYTYNGVNYCRSVNGTTASNSNGYYSNWSCKTVTYGSFYNNSSSTTFTRTYKTSGYSPYCGSNCTVSDLVYYYEECSRSYVAGSKSCASGMTLFDNGVCYYTQKASQTTSNGYYSCSSYGSDWDLSGSNCYKDTSYRQTREANWVSGGTKVNYYCNQGTIYNTSLCKVKVSGTYYCNQGTISGSKCIIKGESTVDYTCPSGYAQSSDRKTCIKNGVKQTQNAESKQTTKNKTNTKWSTEASLEGWTRTGKERNSCLVNN